MKTKRGRKSAAELAVVTAIPGQRPEPPADLTKDQAEEWRAIASRMPAEWFTRETQPLLAALCRYITTHRAISAVIDDLLPHAFKTEADQKSLDRLLTMRDREAKGMVSIETRLRLTPQSRYNAQSAHTAASKSASGKPWQFGS